MSYLLQNISATWKARMTIACAWSILGG